MTLLLPFLLATRCQLSSALEAPDYLSWDGSEYDSRNPRLGPHTDPTEADYLAVAATHSVPEMVAFARGVVSHHGSKVLDEAKFQDMLEYLMGEDSMSFTEMTVELLTSGVESKAIAPPSTNGRPAKRASRRSKYRLRRDIQSLETLEEEGDTPELKPGKHVQILGLFDTGTNLLRALLESNFPDVVPYDMYKPPLGFWKDTDEPGCHVETIHGTKVCSLWKHANLDIIKELAPQRLADFAASNVTAIAMIREPLSWLQSIRKEGYDFAKHGNDPTKASWLSDSVVSSPVFYGGANIRYESLPEIWNNQTASYAHLEDYGFNYSLVIRYEDLVLDTEAVMDRVAQLLGLPAPKRVDQVEKSAKSGNSTGHAEAMEKIESKSYMGLFSTRDVLEACLRISSSVAERHNYTACQPLMEQADAMISDPNHFSA